MLEGILGIVLSSADIRALVSIVGAGELVAVNNAEDTVVDVEVHAEAEIGPVIVSGAIGLAELGTLQENALRDTRVSNTRLNDMEGIVLEIEIHDALSNSVVLCWVLNNWLKEVGLEV